MSDKTEIPSTVLIGTNVPLEVRDRFSAAARAAGRDVSGLLRDFAFKIADQIPPGNARNRQKPRRRIDVRLSEAAAERLLEEANKHKSTAPAWAAAILEWSLTGAVPLDDPTKWVLQDAYLEVQKIVDIAENPHEVSVLGTKLMARLAQAVTSEPASRAGHLDGPERDDRA